MGMGAKAAQIHMGDLMCSDFKLNISQLGFAFWRHRKLLPQFFCCLTKMSNILLNSNTRHCWGHCFLMNLPTSATKPSLEERRMVEHQLPTSSTTAISSPKRILANMKQSSGRWGWCPIWKHLEDHYGTNGGSDRDPWTVQTICDNKNSTQK